MSSYNGYSVASAPGTSFSTISEEIPGPVVHMDFEAQASTLVVGNRRLVLGHQPPEPGNPILDRGV